MPPADGRARLNVSSLGQHLVVVGLLRRCAPGLCQAPLAWPRLGFWLSLSAWADAALARRPGLLCRLIFLLTGWTSTTPCPLRIGDKLHLEGELCPLDYLVSWRYTHKCPFVSPLLQAHKDKPGFRWTHGVGMLTSVAEL